MRRARAIVMAASPRSTPPILSSRPIWQVDRRGSSLHRLPYLFGKMSILHPSRNNLAVQGSPQAETGWPANQRSRSLERASTDT